MRQPNRTSWHHTAGGPRTSIDLGVCIRRRRRPATAGALDRVLARRGEARSSKQGGGVTTKWLLRAHGQSTPRAVGVASKAACEALTHMWSDETKDLPLRVNLFDPGP